MPPQSPANRGNPSGRYLLVTSEQRLSCKGMTGWKRVEVWHPASWDRGRPPVARGAAASQQRVSDASGGDHLRDRVAGAVGERRKRPRDEVGRRRPCRRVRGSRRRLLGHEQLLLGLLELVRAQVPAQQRELVGLLALCVGENRLPESLERAGELHRVDVELLELSEHVLALVLLVHPRSGDGLALVDAARERADDHLLVSLVPGEELA